jgi:hypothetical protein
MQSLERQISSFSPNPKIGDLIALCHAGRADPFDKKEDGSHCSRIRFQLIARQFVSSCLAVTRVADKLV